MDIDGLLGKFEANVKDPAASQLIFESPTGRMLSPEDVVKKPVLGVRIDCEPQKHRLTWIVGHL